MAQIKCEYCGNYIKDTEPNCPSCGAVNSAYVRTASDTPRTIEELQDWYKARNLPPENVTRFFIGKNVHERRAFGIYEEDGNYIVYKNKDDGSRAVRYKGRDEAYAVNEIYMRLKQEIMNQKNLSSQKKRSSVSKSTPIRASGKSGGIGSCLAGCLAIPFSGGCLSKCLLGLAVLFIAGLAGVISDYKTPNSGYYYMGEETPLYYYYGYTSDAPDHSNPYEWWISDSRDGSDWRVLAYYDSAEFPDGIDGKVAQENFVEEHPDVILPWRSEAYIDVHHSEPDDGYYLLDGEIYYYLNDRYGAEYGSQSRSGWYSFDSAGWQHMCTFSQKEELPHGLWYYAADYRLGEKYSDVELLDTGTGAVTDFQLTSYYVDSVNAYKAYVDANPKKPSQGYYTSGGAVYYYLSDPYGKNYGKGDQSGWYTYGDSGWEYYCNYDDSDMLDDNLWYYSDENRIGYSYNDFYTYSDGETWTATDFSETTWYQSAEAAEESHDAAVKSESSSSSSSSSSWSSDSDYDWSSDYDWDSGGSDWSSDW